MEDLQINGAIENADEVNVSWHHDTLHLVISAFFLSGSFLQGLFILKKIK